MPARRRPLRVATATALALCAGCVYGGGAFVGVGSRHGTLAGVEANSGVQFPAQAALGYQTSGKMIYGRLDGVFDLTPSANSDPSLGPAGGGLRAGVGLASPFDPEDVGVAFAVGPSADWLTNGLHGCGQWNNTIALALELRFAGEWQVVVASRFLRGRHECLG